MIDEAKFDQLARSGFSIRHEHAVQIATGERRIAELWHHQNRDVCAAMYRENNEPWTIRFLGGHNHHAEVAWAELLSANGLQQQEAVEALQMLAEALAEAEEA